MRELRRVLKYSGLAILQVPIYPISKTIENPKITHPKEREALFGQHDHVRKYGKDYVMRLREAGFKIHLDYFFKSIGSDSIVTYGLREEIIFLCRKK